MSHSPAAPFDWSRVDSGVEHVWMAIGELRPWKDNPRKNVRAVPKVAESLRCFGWGRPIIANRHPGHEGEIIVGHTALLAASSLGDFVVRGAPGPGLVPVRIVDLEPSKAHGLALADNKTSEISDWDEDLLRSILGSEEIEKDDWLSAGFSEPELEALARPDGLDEDDIPEAPAVAITKPGDLWVLGRHRLICGIPNPGGLEGCTDPAIVARVLAGAKPALMVTDPPYGVNYDPSWRNDVPKKGLVHSASKRIGTVANDDRASWREAWRLSPSHIAYVWHGALHASVVDADLKATGYEHRSQIIWCKPTAPISRGHYHWKHEPCWYGVRKGHQANWRGDRKQTTVWDIAAKKSSSSEQDDEDAATVHGTQKPVEAMARPIRNHDGDVYEPFCGSGSGLIAAEQLDRRCYAIELTPLYVDVTVERWQRLTGQKAHRENAP